MTESFLLTFLRNVYEKKLNYCVVCLRSSEERRLANPYYVKLFAASINQPFKLTDPNHMACYICERQAAAALRYRKASTLATYAISVMDTIKNNHRKYEMIRTCTSDAKNKIWLTSVLQCESEIVQQRARSQMLLTEVLLVSTPSTQPESSHVVLSEDTPMVSILGPQTHISTLGESRDLYVVPDDAPRERVRESWELTQNPEGEISSIIIYDDEDDPINIKTEITPTNDPISLTNDPMSLPIDPMSLTNDLNAQLNTHLIVNTLKDNTNNLVPTEFMLHPIMFNSGMMTVPSLSANIVNGKLVTNNNKSTNVLGQPRLALQVGENLDFISDPNKVKNVLRVLSHQDAAKVHIFTMPNTNQGSGVNVQKAQQSFVTLNQDDGNSIPMINYTIPPIIQVGNTADPSVSNNPSPNKNSSPNKTVIKYSSTSKNPSGIENPSVMQGGPALLRTDRIDWEDKIPMDVISFVDKNDTITKRPRLSAGPKPLGITNVVSLNNEADIIDLC